MKKQSTDESLRIANHLVTYGYAVFTLPELTAYIELIFSDFKQLLTEPEEVKEQWKFFVPELTRKPDRGLIPPKGEGFDLKWFFPLQKKL